MLLETILQKSNFNLAEYSNASYSTNLFLSARLPGPNLKRRFITRYVSTNCTFCRLNEVSRSEDRAVKEPLNKGPKTHIWVF